MHAWKRFDKRAMGTSGKFHQCRLYQFHKVSLCSVANMTILSSPEPSSAKRNDLPDAVFIHSPEKCN